jgi:hypothetical protein
MEPRESCCVSLEAVSRASRLSFQRLSFHSQQRLRLFTQGHMLSAKVMPARTDVPRSYASCALVGNGPGMYLPGMGDIVDRHDAVFKFNLYNLAQRAGKCVPPKPLAGKHNAHRDAAGSRSEVVLKGERLARITRLQNGKRDFSLLAP